MKNKKSTFNKLFKKVSIFIPTVVLVLAFQNCGNMENESFYDVQQEEETEMYTSFNGKTSCSASKVLSFPGAVGFGKNTKGGRGGKVIHVTNLQNDGKGSLRWALEDVKEPRIIVFDVEGRIKIKKEISVRSPYVTVAGQTAPGDGIVLSGGRIHVRTKEVIVRGLKSRPGDERGGDIGRNRDSLSIGGNGIKGVEQIVVDHNSFTWAVDETLTIWGTTKNITLSNNILAEALHDSIHVHETSKDGSTAPHSKGLLIGQKKGEKLSTDITVTRNLLASNHARNPFIKSGYRIEFVNNFITNYGFGHSGLKVGGAGAVTANIMSNYWEDGRDTPNDRRPAFDFKSASSGSKLYFTDNFVEGHGAPSSPIKDRAYGQTQYANNSKKSFASSTPVASYKKVKSLVLDNAGARNYKNELDAVDTRIIRESKNGTSRIIDSQKEVGGYGVYNFRNRKVKDSDRDGIPDSFEIANKSKGLNPNRNDANGDYDGDGYTNIEEYINGLIDGFDLNGCGNAGTAPPANEAPEQPNNENDSDENSDSENSNSENTGDSVVYQAEKMDLRGFDVKTLSAASGKKVIQSAGKATASLDFDLDDGTYDVTIGYFDENDGRSKMSLKVDGKTIETFTWAKKLGSSLANNKTKATHVIKGVKIKKRQNVELVGVANGKEPLRTDYIRFQKKKTSESQDSYSNSNSDFEAGRIEAEDMDLSSDMKVVRSAVASGKAWVQTKSSGSISFEFDGPSGRYNLKLGYFDENDGVSTMSLKVSGKTKQTWRWSQNLKSSSANKSTATTRTFKRVSLKRGDIITFTGKSNKNEPLRTDYLDITAN